MQVLLHSPIERAPTQLRTGNRHNETRNVSLQRASFENDGNPEGSTHIGATFTLPVNPGNLTLIPLSVYECKATDALTLLVHWIRIYFQRPIRSSSSNGYSACNPTHWHTGRIK